MNETKRSFAEKLIAADPPSGDARQRYEKEVRAMLETTLTPRQRGVYLVGAVLLLVPAMFFASIVLQPPPADAEFVKFIWVYMVMTAAMLVVLAGILFRGYWRGIIVQTSNRKWAARLGVAYVAILGLLFMGGARHAPELLREETRVMGMLLVLYAAIAWVRSGIVQAESKTAEKLLEIELRLAEIGEALVAGGHAQRELPEPRK